MNLFDKIAARCFMSGEPNQSELGAELCASCGVKRATERIAKVMSSAFNQTQWLLCDSQFVCSRCLALFKDKTSRSKCLYFPSPSKKVLLEREEILPLLRNPPDDPYVLCLPYSFQKHTFFHAGISTKDCAWISTDDFPVKLDYKAHDIPAVISQIAEMLTGGVPRKELACGVYSTFTRARFGKQLDAWEGVLAPLRPDGAINLIVTYSPPTKEKIKCEVEPMAFSETESAAINVLAVLAQSSSCRSSDGITFWSSYFRRRINRHLRKPNLHAFFSAVAADIGCNSTVLDIAPLKSFSEEFATRIFQELREKTELILAGAYTQLKEKQEEAKAETPRSTSRQKQKTTSKGLKNGTSLF